MIEVGIHENVYIKNVSINDRNTLEVVVGKGESGITLEELLNTDSYPITEGRLSIWPLKNTIGSQSLSANELLTDHVKRLKDKLTHILKVFVAEDDIKWNYFEGTPIVDNETMIEHITDQQVLTLISSNMFNYFIELLAPFIQSEDKKKLRLKLVRQSANKHYPAFPKYPYFIESMDVLESKLKYSAWELQRGLNDPNPVQVEESDPGASQSANELFSS